MVAKEWHDLTCVSKRCSGCHVENRPGQRVGASGWQEQKQKTSLEASVMTRGREGSRWNKQRGQRWAQGVRFWIYFSRESWQDLLTVWMWMGVKDKCGGWFLRVWSPYLESCSCYLASWEAWKSSRCCGEGGFGLIRLDASLIIWIQTDIKYQSVECDVLHLK